VGDKLILWVSVHDIIFILHLMLAYLNKNSRLTEGLTGLPKFVSKDQKHSSAISTACGLGRNGLIISFYGKQQ